MKYYDIEKGITALISRKMEAALAEFRHEGVKLLSHLKYRVAWDPTSRETVLIAWGVLGGKEHEQSRIKNEIAREIELLQQAGKLVGKASLVY